MGVEKEELAVMEPNTADIHHADDLSKPVIEDAVDAENREHEMGLWEAAKKHPWACFWAFVMCFTIVGSSTVSL